MDIGRLFGKLLGYPECCIEQFLDQFAFGRRSVGGFCPCDEHAKVEDLADVIGRNPEIEPPEFTEFLEDGNVDFDKGLEVYSRYGKADFFKECWENS